MRISKIRYRDNNLILNNLNLGQINLIVGKNATGKSRTILMIDSIAKMITQKIEIAWGNWDITFTTIENQTIRYLIRSNSFNSIYSEKIYLNEKLVLNRQKNNAKIFSFVENKFQEINPPESKLVLHIRRDIKEYPFLEQLVFWAENSYIFEFGKFSPSFDYTFAIGEGIPLLLKDLNSQSIINVINELNTIGFKIADIFVKEKKEQLVLYIKEKEVLKAIPYYQLSQGMYRTLALIIYLEYLISNSKTTTLIIDDLCEGLDYDRATKFGKLLYNKFSNTFIQLIITSNDSFLMDVIDIEHWNILLRNEKTLTIYNPIDYPDLFKKFRFTGLSNFDLLSSDYIRKYDEKNSNIR
jgi:hypothetical protein